MPKIRKRTSKRQGLREKYTVVKKVKEHARKVRKAANKLKKAGNSVPLKINKGKKNQIPNSFPLKEQVLNEMEAEFEAEKIIEKEQKKEQKLLEGLPKNK